MPRVKHSAMFDLTATVILFQFKHARVLVSIYFNDMQIYTSIYGISNKDTHIYFEIYKFSHIFLLIVKID